MSDADETASTADISAGTAHGLPLVRFNRVPRVGTGRELAAAAVAALQRLAPATIHPRYQDGYSGT